MDFDYELFIDRSFNELHLAGIIQKLSDEPQLQITIFHVKEDTYYSATISHAYFAIFYAAKAYLLSKGVKTQAPSEHRKTIEEFAKYTQQGIIDVELLYIYQKLFIKANVLLHIFELEKGKRATFTYKRLPQANKEPAAESLKNAELFYKNIKLLLENHKIK